ncbi:uncharacterized protein LOC126787449 [Argentina anserina]|uniref:uncharacterized protein LOC126787449 n=1 Tax=Argentina anserina TaxID=57926 RepID=UPI00217630B0|nr:uncharacterized protein LOC126787449 [Potentilla anserina]
MEDNKSAYYVHSFAHGLHSILMEEAKIHKEVMGFFTEVTNVVNVVGTFVQCRDTLQKKHGVLVLEALSTDVLEVIAEFGSDSEQKYKAEVLLDSLQSFNFIFCLHMIVMILRITLDLAQALQGKDQDILKVMRSHIEKMDDVFLTRGRPRHKAQMITNKYHYCVDLFYNVTDMQLRALNSLFTETTTGLLRCAVCLSPSDSFSAFDKLKLIQLAQYYPIDFSATDLMVLEDQLENYIFDMHSSNEFSSLKGISDLAEKLVETGKDQVFPLVYLLATLALILPVATPKVERLFSAVDFLKNRLHMQMEDKWMRNSLIGYVEKDIPDSIDNKVILQRLQHVKKFSWKL